MPVHRAVTRPLQVFVGVVFVFTFCPAAWAQNWSEINAVTAAGVLPDAEMSQDVYSVTSDPAALSGWKPIGNWDQIFAGSPSLKSEISAAAATGFYARVYEDAKGNITIAYRGTEGPGEFFSTDVPAQTNLNPLQKIQIPAQYTYASQLAAFVKQSYSNAPITLTGHSLGGGLATYAAQQVPGISNVVTFNAARPPILSSATLGGVNQINVVAPGDAIGDPKSGGGDIEGFGKLPGTTYAVTSTTATPENALSRAAGFWASNTHSLQGIIGGLEQTEKASSNSSSSSNQVAHQASTGGASSEPSSSTPENGANSGRIFGAAGPQTRPTVAEHVTSQSPAPPRITFGGGSSTKTQQAAPASVETPTSNTVPRASFAPGGISLTKAAAERLPLHLTLEGAYVENGRIILAGRRDASDSIDAALFLTALRAACQNSDPYFSLDPDDILSWMGETKEAQNELRDTIKHYTVWHFRKHIPRNAPSIVQFSTISARRDFPQLWNSILAKYPDLRSRLVFRPQWLRETRFGEIMYKADILLKELAGGATALGETRFRAASIEGYRSATEQLAARNLLYNYNSWPQETHPEAGGRIWYDLTESSDTVVGKPELIPQGGSELRNLLDRRQLLTTSDQQSPPQRILANGGAIDLSDIYPRMFVRARDPATLRDSAAQFPGLDGLVAEANQTPQEYAATYNEYRQLAQGLPRLHCCGSDPGKRPNSGDLLSHSQRAC